MNAQFIPYRFNPGALFRRDFSEPFFLAREDGSRQSDFPVFDGDLNAPGVNLTIPGQAFGDVFPDTRV
jgi:hypothetical protein